MAGVGRVPDFPWGRRTLVMGIVNCTPDSFSGDGCGSDPAAAVRRGLEQAAAGADMLDVGGESTRPGAPEVGADEELRRILPVIEGLRRVCSLPISVDTIKAEVADAALHAGACIVNDVWGLRRDRRMAEVAACHGAGLIIVHNRPAQARVDALGGMYPEVTYRDLIGEVRAELTEAAAWAMQAGVPRGDVWCDPGLGFGKTPSQNLELLRRVGELRTGHPLLVGASRKSFIGRVLGLPAAERDPGTAACVSLAVAGGADVVRVHNVGMLTQVTRMADAVWRGWTP